MGGVGVLGMLNPNAGKEKLLLCPVFGCGAQVWRTAICMQMNRESRRGNQGDMRIDYSDSKQPISKMVTRGNLALCVVARAGSRFPLHQSNAKQDLHVAIPGDFNLDGHGRRSGRGDLEKKKDGAARKKSTGRWQFMMAGWMRPTSSCGKASLRAIGCQSTNRPNNG